jgi:crotonobetainyl-CoA:carnitine CoA-transferase CaiB-like acyl-CoA transferase
MSSGGAASPGVVKLFDGVRVLDLSRMLAGPYGSMLLADTGAEVIKIEEPDGGDPMRIMGPPFLSDGGSAYFLAINRNKKSVALDLKKPDGRAVFLELVRTADVVWENFRPGILERLGCPPPALRAAHPRLIVCSISAYGGDGPYRDWPAFDLALQAMGGAMSLTGERDGRPVRMGLPMGDLAGGMFGAFAVAGALFRRSRTGEGACLDLSLLDCQVSLLTYIAQYFWTDGRVPGPLGSAHASVVPYGALQTRDGHLIVAVFAEKFWGAFCRAVEHPEWEGDPRFARNRDRVAHRAALMALVEEVFAVRTTEEWLKRLHAEGVPSAPILSVDRVLSDPQVRHRQMVIDLVHPSLGRVPTLGTPIKLDGAMGLTPAPAPRLGEHTDEVLANLLGYSPDRLAALRAAGVVA